MFQTTNQVSVKTGYKIHVFCDRLKKRSYTEGSEGMILLAQLATFTARSSASSEQVANNYYL